ARGFAEQGVTSAGVELLASTDNHAGAKLYARILTRLRQQEAAYSTLQNAFASASSSLPVIKEQIAKEGIAAAKNGEWRQREREASATNRRYERLHRTPEATVDRDGAWSTVGTLLFTIKRRQPVCCVRCRGAGLSFSGGRRKRTAAARFGGPELFDRRESET